MTRICLIQVNQLEDSIIRVYEQAAIWQSGLKFLNAQLLDSYCYTAFVLINFYLGLEKIKLAFTDPVRPNCVALYIEHLKRQNTFYKHRPSTLFDIFSYCDLGHLSSRLRYVCLLLSAFQPLKTTAC